MIVSGLCLLLLAVYEVRCESDDKKWVWGSRRNDRTYTGVASSSNYAAALLSPSESLFKPDSNFEGTLSPQATKLRYQVSEPSDFPNPPPLNNRPSVYPEEQYRPTTTTINGFRPDSNRPPNQDNFRPGNRPNQNGFRPDQNGFRPNQNGYRPNQNGFSSNENGFRPNQNGFRPPQDGYSPSNGYRPTGGPIYRPGSGSDGYRPVTGPNGRPVLTGPVPSWEQGGNRYKGYDRCKCVHSFNCNTPGIKFGSCDADKQYCCYNDGGEAHHGNFHGDRQKPVLVGPGGPIDRPSQYRPYKEGILSGPSRPDLNNNRYSTRFGENSDESLDEAYKKGLESAIRETVYRPNRFNNGRGESSGYNDYYSEDSFNRRPRPNHKYGLYQPSEYDLYGGRSANLNSTIEAEPEGKKSKL